MSALKIVVTGPVSAGKTTFIHSVTDHPPLSTEQRVSESSGKPRTTVGLDFGRTTVADHSVKLFGTPGQERFGYMREILSEGADGLVILVPSDRPEVLSETLKIIDPVITDASPPLTIGITRTDLNRGRIPEKTHKTLGPRAQRIECIDARQEEQCRRLLIPLVNRQ